MLKQIKMKNFSYCLLLLIISLSFFIIQPLYADIYGYEQAGTNAGVKEGAQQIPGILGGLAGAALALAGGIFVFLLVYGGIMIMTAAGSPDKAKKGQGIIIWAIIGAVILGAAVIITNLIFGIFSK